jgi:hypothetical protein
VYAAAASLVDINVNAVEKNTEALLVPSKEVYLEINVAEKTKNMFMICRHNAGQNHNYDR